MLLGLAVLAGVLELMDKLAVLVVLVLFTSWSFMYEIRNH
jgi:hypothetical protein